MHHNRKVHQNWMFTVEHICSVYTCTKTIVIIGFMCYVSVYWWALSCPVLWYNWWVMLIIGGWLSAVYRRLLKPQTAQLLSSTVICSVIWDRTTEAQLYSTRMRQPSQKYSKIFGHYIDQENPTVGKGGNPCKV